MKRKAIIIGAGPAGLTAAYELLTRTDIVPIILEKSGEIGGISRTTDYKGNRMDMGPHRFFSKSDRVMDWWLKMMPLETEHNGETTISYQNKSRNIPASESTAGQKDKVMLVIRRLTRIYFLRTFFAYPIQLSLDALRTLGLIRTIRILISFLWIRLFPRKPENSLEDFIINKFGKQLYLLFFRDYTEKVWGIAPSQISADWGAQRIKGVSLSKAVATAVKSLRQKKADLRQKDTETSLVEQFLYPKYGPGSLWEEVARQVQEKGGELHLHQDVTRIFTSDGRIQSVTTVNSLTGELSAWESDYFFSTMPVQELIAGMGSEVPTEVQQVAAGLQYRDFINVGILLKQFSTKRGQTLELKDNWIYIQEREVKVGRLMIYNNWGGGMINNPETVWLGMEYFCNKTDAFWAESDEAIQRFAIQELAQLDLAQPEDVLDSTVRRVEKTYPAYFGTYDRFDTIRAYTDTFENLFLVGRNGMHKYNNADHSMLTAMVAVDNIAAGITSKANLWAVNTEQEYHEEKQKEITPETAAAPSGHPFLYDFLWRNKPNRAWWITAFAVFILQFIVFKFRFPFANYMPDSYYYLEAASSNADVNMWPVAYSKFLRLVSVFMHSDKAVTAMQYFFMQAATLLLIFSFLYWLRPHRTTKIIMLTFFMISPLPLFVANYISADSLFIGFSLLWLTTLVWIIFKPAGWLIPVHAFILLACFTLRYNAIYYPFVSALAFLLSRQGVGRKLVGIGLAFALVAASFLYTSQKMKDTVGQWQFSAFGGWQMANNALYMYQHIPPAERPVMPQRFAALETMVRQHMDTLNRVKFSHEDSANNFFYLWSGRGPLLQYLYRQYKRDTATTFFKKWASEGPLYQQYAFFLIRRFPVQFALEFMLPNAIRYAAPPTDFLSTYNMDGDSVRKLAKDWFNYKRRKVQEKGGRKDGFFLATEWFPIFGAAANVLMVAGILGLFLLGAFQWKKHGFAQLSLLVLVFWLINAGFSIFASPVVLRYLVFPLIVAFILGTICMERLGRLAFAKRE